MIFVQNLGQWPPFPAKIEFLLKLWQKGVRTLYTSKNNFSIPLKSVVVTCYHKMSMKLQVSLLNQNKLQIFLQVFRWCKFLYASMVIGQGFPAHSPQAVCGPRGKYFILFVE